MDELLLNQESMWKLFNHELVLGFVVVDQTSCLERNLKLPEDLGMVKKCGFKFCSVWVCREM